MQCIYAVTKKIMIKVKEPAYPRCFVVVIARATAITAKVKPRY
jgi:hypothetical protein